MKKRVISFIAAAAIAVSAMPAIGAGAAEEAVSADYTIRLSPENASPFNNGKFEGWGTSMGWWGNRIGYSDKLAQDSAELFYSEDGLGLDIVRYNVGGGDDPSHNHITRSDSKLPCFAVLEYNEDGTVKTDDDGKYVYTYVWDEEGYDDSSDPQTNVLEKIKEQNDDVHIEGYTNSPPWFMTESGCSGGGTATYDSNGKITAVAENLSPDNYAQFASFLADVTEHFDEIGLHFDSYSPMNEPNPATKYWAANNAKQEGNLVAQGEHQSGLITAVRSAFDEKNIDTIIAGPDETSIKYSSASYNALTDDAKAALGRFDTHSYSDRSASNFASLRSTAESSGKNFWMSEVDNGNTAGTNSGDMGSALNLANFILEDMNSMQPSAWVMWDILDKHKDSNFTDPNGNKSEENNTLDQDGGLWGVGMVNHDTQEIELTKKYYGYGQFTRYIQPGMTIIDSSSNTLAAYNKESGEIVIVAVNTAGTDKTAEFDLREFSSVADEAKVIRTSGAYETGENWAELDPITISDKEFSAVLKANSITTYVIGSDADVNEFSASSDGLSYSYTTSGAMQGKDKYFAIYNPDKTLNTIIKNESNGKLSGDYTSCTFKLMIWNDDMSPATEPVTETAKEKNISYMNISGSTTLVAGVGYSYSAVSDTDLTGKTIKWSVSDNTIADVSSDSENGCTVTAKSGGTFTLKAETEDGIYTAVDLTAIASDQAITITNKNSGLGLETKSKGVASGTLLVQWEDRGLDTAAWTLSATDDGYFNIINKNANMLLISNTDAKPAISSDTEKTDDTAKWELINHGGYYEIKNVSVGKSLNVSGQSAANGGNVILYTYGGGDNELWSLNVIEDALSLEHVIPEVIDYSEKYTDTDYTFVSNVDAATNNFDDGDSKGFTFDGFAGLGSDGDGEAVLLPQNSLSNNSSTQRSGTATLSLSPSVTCSDGQIINMSFDMFTPNSNGDSVFKLTANDSSATELVNITVNNWGGTYAITIGGTSVVTDGDGKTYFKNNVSDKENTSYIKNGGHVEIYYAPSNGNITVTVKNVTGSAEMKTYTGTAATSLGISAVEFSGTYTAWNKIMVVDNLITNIITEKTE